MYDYLRMLSDVIDEMNGIIIQTQVLSSNVGVDLSTLNYPINFS